MLERFAKCFEEEDGGGANMAHPNFPRDLSFRMCESVVKLLEHLRRRFAREPLDSKNVTIEKSHGSPAHTCQTVGNGFLGSGEMRRSTLEELDAPCGTQNLRNIRLRQQ